MCVCACVGVGACVYVCVGQRNQLMLETIFLPSLTL